MELLWAIIVWTVFGLVCGAIARLLIPGRQPLGIVMTALLGVVGSFLGGFIAYAVWGGQPLQASGLLLSIIGAVVVLGIFVAMSRRRSTHRAASGF